MVADPFLRNGQQSQKNLPSLSSETLWSLPPDFEGTYHCRFHRLFVRPYFLPLCSFHFSFRRRKASFTFLLAVSCTSAKYLSNRSRTLNISVSYSSPSRRSLKNSIPVSVRQRVTPIGKLLSGTTGLTCFAILLRWQTRRATPALRELGSCTGLHQLSILGHHQVGFCPCRCIGRI